MERFLSSEEIEPEWEETQGTGAIRWLLAETSSSEICLINTLDWFVVHTGEPVGEARAEGSLRWRLLECLVGCIPFLFRRHGCRGHIVTWYLVTVE